MLAAVSLDVIAARATRSRSFPSRRCRKLPRDVEEDWRDGLIYRCPFEFRGLQLRSPSHASIGKLGRISRFISRSDDAP